MHPRGTTNSYEKKVLQKKFTRYLKNQRVNTNILQMISAHSPSRYSFTSSVSDEFKVSCCHNPGKVFWKPSTKQ